MRPFYNPDNKPLFIAENTLYQVGCFTVIIPSLLISESVKTMFLYTLDQFSNSDLVKQIIVIDNTKDKCIGKKLGVISNKIKIIDDQPDLYFNPALNYGIRFCDTEYYLMTSDDFLCHKIIVDDFYNVFQKEKNIGLLQVNTDRGTENDIENYDTYFRKEYPRKTVYHDSFELLGGVMVGYTKDWIDIPEDLKIFCGDSMVQFVSHLRNQRMFKIVSSYVLHYCSATTSQPEIMNYSEVLEKERIIYEKLQIQLRKEIK